MKTGDEKEVRVNSLDTLAFMLRSNLSEWQHQSRITDIEMMVILTRLLLWNSREVHDGEISRRIKPR